MQAKDKVRLQHMLDAIEEALSFVKNLGRESLLGPDPRPRLPFAAS